MTANEGAVEAAGLRDARAALVTDLDLGGPAFGRALAGILDDAFERLTEGHAVPVPVAVVALGSYGRRELCPGSDVDVMLLAGSGRGRRRRPDLRGLAEHLWYPLWDAGFVLGHAARTVRDALELAESDLDALTSLLEVRHVAGDASLTAEVLERGRVLARRRRDRVVGALAAASTVRRVKPGPIAEMLEPDLKDGSGGLRDLQSLEWAGWAIAEPGEAGGLPALQARGYLSAGDAVRLAAARPLLLDVRVALHRLTGNRSDLLALQEQDAVAALIDAADADALVRDLAGAARQVSWVAGEVWARLRDTIAGPGGRVVRADRPVADGVVLREGRVVLAGQEPGNRALSALTVLEAAAAAAENDAPFDRASLDRLREMAPPAWDAGERAAFLRLLRCGERAVPVFEALDHVGTLARLLPEWDVVRSRPQRNAYHRYTVDRHLLETVAECARLLDAGDGDGDDLDSVVARACRRPELLLLTALLHDIGKGLATTDHEGYGAHAATEIARRMRLDSEAAEVVPWLVRDHLVMADTATRRDLSDEKTVRRFADTVVGDAERLRLLYLLTIGDSRATGPAAWSSAKAALLRDLFVKAAAVVESASADPVVSSRRLGLAERIGVEAAEQHLAALPPAYLLAFDADAMAAHRALLAGHAVAVSCEEMGDGVVVVTIVAPDRVGLLATVAGALTAAGLAVREASLFTTADGMALDAFRSVDPYGRLTGGGKERVEEMLRDALSDELDVEAAVLTRVRNYHRPGLTRGPVAVATYLDASETATVVEVHADDEVGLLYRLARVFAAMAVDVSVAKVATLGERVVDVFYVRDADGSKIEDPAVIARIESALASGLGGPPTA